MKMNVGKITNRKRFDECEVLTSEKIKKELDSVIEKIDANMQRFQDAFPMPASKEGKYPLEPNTNDWTQGFWTGMLWLAYEYTKNEKYKAAAEKQPRKGWDLKGAHCQVPGVLQKTNWYVYHVTNT